MPDKQRKWRLCESSNGDVWRIRNERNHAIIYVESDESDARLCAASPDLLVEVKRQRKVIDNLRRKASGDLRYAEYGWDPENRTDALIAEAEGKS